AGGRDRNLSRVLDLVLLPRARARGCDGPARGKRARSSLPPAAHAGGRHAGQREASGAQRVPDREGMTSTERALDRWPPLAYAELKDTLHAVHMWTQVVGKIRLALTPLVNHWWNSTLYVTPRGLTTAMMPSGNDALQIDFDFVDHELVIVTSRGGRSSIPLAPMSVAHFYRQVLDR